MSGQQRQLAHQKSLEKLNGPVLPWNVQMKNMARKDAWMPKLNNYMLNW